MLRVIRGENRKKYLPWVPRFDLYFNAHHTSGTLPQKYLHCKSALEISRKMGVGYHGVTPDYLKSSEPDALVDRGLGIYRVREYPFYARLRNVERTVEQIEDATRVTYRTPVGTVWTEFVFTDEMRESGTTISWIKKHAVESYEDLAVVGYIFENIEVEPAYGGYTVYSDEIGKSGIAVANVCTAASPMHFILKDLMNFTRFFISLYENSNELTRLSEQIGTYMKKLMAVTVEAPAELFQFGSNFDATITYPPFFKKHILPWIEEFSSMAHERGKFILCHTDSENQGLWELYLQSGTDVCEAVAVKPMTKNTIREILSFVKGTVTIFGGINSILLLPEMFDEKQFEDAVFEVLDAVSDNDRIILGISDTTPVNADFNRIERIRDIVYDFNMN